MSTLTSPSDVEIAWAAGLFEGEGCVAQHTYVTKVGIRRPRLIVVSTDRDGLDAFHAIVGMGHMREEKWRPANGTHWKRSWRWSVESKADVESVLTMLLPYFKMQRRITASQQALQDCK